MADTLEDFLANLHHTSKLLVRGKAVVMGNTVDAALVTNMYGQRIVWGMFSVERGKFKGKLANSANTEDVVFRYPETLEFEWTTTISSAEKRLWDSWKSSVMRNGATVH